MSAVSESRGLQPVPHSPQARPAGWWGMVLVIATEATLFLLLVASYFFLRVETIGSWPPPPHVPPKLLEPLLATLVLVIGSLGVACAGRAVRAGRPGLTRVCLVAALLAVCGFLVFQGILVHNSLRELGPREDAYASIYYTLIGVHYAHVAVAALLVVWALLHSPRFTPERHLTLQVTALYVHFVNVVAVLVFATLYLAPRG
jgi:heme/copper-type cytochrome/quinol oxidase subunit 3